MKKNVIALLLAVVMASGSIGSVPALAAETTAEAAVAVEEETIEEAEEIPEETDPVEASDTTAEEVVTVEEEIVDSEEAPAETEEAVTDESAEDASVGEAAEDIEEAVDDEDDVSGQDISEDAAAPKDVSDNENEEIVYEKDEGKVTELVDEEIETKEAQDSAIADEGDISQIPDDAEYWCGHYYKAFPIKNTPLAAQNYCESLGGYLATSNNPLENEFLKSLISNYSGYEQAIIGGTDDGHEGTWNWLNGEDLYYTDWYTYWRQPDGGDAENYMVLSWYRYGWHDIAADSEQSMFLCEWGDRIDLSTLKKGSINLSQTSFVYNGSTQRPNVTIYYNGDTNYPLYENYDYTIRHIHNVNLGTATAIITGIGRYTGEVRVNYYIVPDAPKNIKLSRDNAKRGIKVEWDEMDGISEFDIRLATDKSYLNDVENDNAPVYNFTYGEDDDKAYYTGTLNRGMTYYVQVRAVADRSHPEAVGAWSEIKEINTGNQLVKDEFWGFTNTGSVEVGYDYFCRIYGPTQAAMLFIGFGGRNYTNAKLSGGICYGMVTYGEAVYDTYARSPFGIGTLKNITSLNDAKKYSIGNDFTAKDGIVFCHLLQGRSDYIDLYHTDLDSLYNAVKACDEGQANGFPVDIGLLENSYADTKGQLNHHIYAICTEPEMDTSSSSVIRVYDPNTPNDSERYLYLLKDSNGHFNGWTFTGKFGGEFEMSGTTNTISDTDCIMYSVNIGKKINSDLPSILDGYNFWYPAHELLLNIELPIFYVESAAETISNIKSRLNQIIFGDSYYAGLNNNQMLYHVTGSDPIELSQVPAGSTIRYASNYHMVTVDLSSDADLVFNVSDDNTGSVKILPSENGTYSVTYTYQEAVESDAVETTITCDLEKGKEATITKLGADDIRALGVTNLTYHSDTGTRNDYAVIEAPVSHDSSKEGLDPASEYKMTEAEGEAQILSKDENDNFTIVEAGETETVRKSIANVSIENLNSEYDYTGKEIKPAIIVSDNGNELKSGIDYSVEYQNNVEPGEATIVLTGIGDYKDTKQVSFIIVEKSSDIIDSGTCGTNATWAIDADGTFTLSGTGETESYMNDTLVPWRKHSESVKKVIVKEGITTLGQSMFYGCSNLTEVQLPTSLTKIEGCAFQNCSNLTTVKWSDNITEIGNWAFGYCSSLTSMTLPKKTETLGNYTFFECNNLSELYVGKALKQIGNYCFHSMKTAVTLNIYYAGTQNEWSAITLGTANARIESAAITYNAIHETKVSSILLDKTEMTILKGGVLPLTAEVKPDDADNKTIEWKTSDDSVAVVTSKGVVVGVGDGTCVVTAIAADGSGVTADCKVTVISPISIADAEISDVADKTFTGQAIEQSPLIKVGADTLEKNRDYTVSYINNTNVGTATITITGKGFYTGTVEKTFEITPKTITPTITLSQASFVYNGSAQKPSVTAKDADNTVLTEGIDYTVSYTNNTNAGTASIVITGKGNYTGTGTKTFAINKAAQSITAKSSVASVSVGKTATVSTTGAKGTVTYTSSDVTVATVDGKTGVITAKKVGTVTITARSAATANYGAASKAVTVKVVPAATASLSAANLSTGIKLKWKKVAGANGYIIYRNGTKIKTITNGTTVTFSDTKANTNGKKYTYKVVAKGATGTSTLSRSRIMYRVARTAVSSLASRTAGKMTVKWKRNSKANGYIVQYSKSKSFSSGNKTSTITKNTLINKTFRSLTKGKKYYVRVRCFKTVSGKKYYSSWSAVKAVTVKK